MSEHTPSPWTIVEHNWCETGIYGDDKSHVAALRLGSDESNYKEEIEEESAIVAANARLIAAASDLYASLKKVMTWIENWNPNFSLDDDWLNDEAMAKAALAKARGEHP